MSEPTAPSTRRRRLLVLAICCLSLFIVGLDNTVVNIALPSIQQELHAPASGLQWIIDAYTLVLASLLILSGSVADRIGRRRVFRAGLLLFVLGSLLCSLAPSLEWLIAFRALQAVGGSMLNPVAMSIITNTFTDPRERAQAIGVWGGVVGISMALGPLIGGFLVNGAGWPSIFLINVPVGLAACALTFRHIPESRAPRPRRLDPVGQVLMVLLLGAGTAVIIEGPGHGWTSPGILLLAGVAAAALLALPWWELRTAEPLIDPRFFRSVPFTGATLTAVCAFAALGGFLFLNTLYLQDVRHYSPVEAGLWTLPMAGLTLICAPLSGRIVGRRGPRGPLLVAGAALAASGLLLTRLATDSPAGLLLLAYALFGLGFGTVNAPITNAAVSGMPNSRAGVAAAVASTSRQVGQSLGVAVLGTVVTTAVTGPMATGFAQASHGGWWIMTGLGVVVLLLGLVTTTAWAARTAFAVALRIDPERSRQPA
ncbi:MFS transporter [Kitasatospora atroaurantiaca]|uniref:EmrB/QacA subfamily drug resistance transporter n=1 Tax=Kitasatospora atroaurantiaca TaxID=285545 RepID=A0A561EMH1_9ACTN|nr:MFS transporter [Kitasatospora atroaurantiaca]TWE16800.1 EmrB/QacA subfamily drug resistance transporter [Kitasatospora atroaurantiaca]